MKAEGIANRVSTEHSSYFNGEKQCKSDTEARRCIARVYKRDHWHWKGKGLMAIGVSGSTGVRLDA